MKRGEITDSIPSDLINEIFLRLPAKSIARFRCVSKLWGSMLCHPYFTELFLTRSSACPRLLFLVAQYPEWLFFSSPQPQNPYDKSSLVLATDFHIKFSGEFCQYICSYASGFLHDTGSMICNPITGQYAILPKLKRYKEQISFLGFDPIDKQYKVLFMAYPYCNNDNKILTLGNGKISWRNIHCPLTHECFRKGICISGVLYYVARPISRSYDEGPYVIVCFDVRSEKFKFVDAKFCPSWPLDLVLINYKGKLGGIILKYASDGGFPLELRVWVLEDVEKHEWSKYVYSLWDENKVVKVAYNLSIAGMTTTCEIILSMKYTSKPYYVYYFNPERNTLRSIEIQGFEECDKVGGVFAFVDYVEDLNVNDTKQLKSSLLHQGLTKYH